MSRATNKASNEVVQVNVKFVTAWLLYIQWMGRGDNILVDGGGEGVVVSMSLYTKGLKQPVK